ncbi:MAG: regulatory protein RecX [Ferruginibacter sp.]
MNEKKLTPGQAAQKIKQFCTYQERSHAEVKEKLYLYGLYPKEVDEIVSNLVQDNYLNEERFAIQFAGGKFRMKKWGRVKIKYELKQKRVSEYCIKKALKEIDEDDYLQTLNDLLEQKLKTLKSEKNIFIKKKKLQVYLMQKGFESDLLRELINKI